MDFFLDASYFQKDGKIKPLTNSKIYFVPIGFGLKYRYDLIENLNLFFKLGANWFHIKQKQKNLKITKTGFGAITSFGINLKMRAGWMIGIFLEYLYDKKTIEHLEYKISHVGGLSSGGSLSYRF